MQHTTKQEQPQAKKPSTEVQPTAQNGDLSEAAIGAIQRQEAPYQRLRPADIAALQRTVGNQVVQRLLNRQRKPEATHSDTPIVQPKLTVGPVTDRYEEEADNVASQVMRMSNVQRSPSIKKIQRTGKSEDGFETDSNFDAQLSHTKGHGQPLPDSTRGEFESKFGSSFENVRVHSNAESNQLNHSIQAKAFTHGNDIHFASGQYNPGSSDGKRLIAHELTHTIQQTGGQKLQRREEDLPADNHVASAPNLSIQRKLNFKETDLAGTLSKKARFKGFFGKTSTFAKIQNELANYHKADGPGEELASLTILDKLVGHWVVTHLADKNNGEKMKSILELQFAIKDEIPRVEKRIQDDKEEQNEYVRQLENASLRKDTSLKFLSTGGVGMYKNMKGWHSGTDQMGDRAVNVHNMSKKYGLTLAEVSAIGIYTADDYKYMNPAMAQNRGWMAAMLPRVGMASLSLMGKVQEGVTDTHVDDAMAEGQLHGKIAKSGMKKMPNWIGMAYRGVGLTEEEFATQYPINGISTFPAFSSTSLKEGVSKTFARTEATGTKVAILLKLQVTKGKDIAPLSNSPHEAEVLLMPGATFRVAQIRETEYKGKKLYEVTMRQEK